MKSIEQGEPLIGARGALAVTHGRPAGTNLAAGDEDVTRVLGDSLPGDNHHSSGRCRSLRVNAEKARDYA